MAPSPLTGSARRGVALGVGMALLGAGLAATPAGAAPRPLPMADCTTSATPIEIFHFNDFHGRIMEAAKLFTPVEKARTAGKNVVLLSGGDNIGGSTFESASQDDKPTLDILNAAKLDTSAAGNHEFDKGADDLTGRVSDIADFDYLAANVTTADGSVPAPLKAFHIKDVNGIKVATIGVVTADLPSLVSPAGLSGLTIGDPVVAVNKYAAELTDGNADNGEADVVIAEIHEGAANGKITPAENAAASAAFKAIYENVSPKVNVVFNGHTHQTYSWTTSATGVPLVQAASYGEKLAQVSLSVDKGAVCGTPTVSMLDIKNGTADTSLPTIASISQIAQDAKQKADVIGAEVIADATGPISLPGGLMKPDQRDKESPMSNLVAQFFYEKVGASSAGFIGVQNPGGTRAGFDKGEVTLKEAALALPFANTIKTTELTGAQVKRVLEQQWQRDKDGNVPSRAFLRLGLSENVSYTYDESRAEGDRITSITVDGKPIDTAATYTLASGNFLIDGGDNFHEFAKGTNSRDTGLVDLTAFMEWTKAKKTLTPDYSMRGVSVKGWPTPMWEAGIHTLTNLGLPKQGGVAPDTLDSTGQEAPKNTTATAYVVQGATRLKVGQAAVTDGVVPSITLRIPNNAALTTGTASLVIETAPGQTVVRLPITVGQHSSNPPYVWGDVTGDGWGDTLTVDSKGRMWVYHGKKEGFAGSRAQIGYGWGGHQWIGHTPDLNGDGIGDLLAIDDKGDMYRWFGTGMGGFRKDAKVSFGWNAGFTNVTVLGQVTPDGAIELSANHNGMIRVYSVGGKGGMQEKLRYGNGWGIITHSTGAGDFNKDGVNDLYTVNTRGELSVYLFNKAGVIIDRKVVATGMKGVTAFYAPGDLTGDRVPDMVYRNTAGEMFLVTNNRGSVGAPKKIGKGWGSFRLFA